MSKTFNKNIPYNFTGSISLSTSGNLNIPNSITSGAARFTGSLNATASNHTLGSILISGGNVGINMFSPGTTSFNGDLHITARSTGGENPAILTLQPNSSIFARGQCQIRAVSDATLGAGAGLTFSTRADNGANFDPTALISERMRISQSGNVGIGTTVPNYTLEVNGSTRLATTLLVGLSSGNLTGVSGMNNVTSQAFVVGMSGGSMYTRELSTGVVQSQTYSGASNTGQIHLQPYGGNVGIGTTAPAWALQVNGNGFFSNSIGVSGGYSWYWMTASTTSNYVSIGGSGATPLASGGINITFNGLVGIGTTSPGTSLHVYNPTNPYTMYLEGSNSSGGMRISSSTNYLEFGIAVAAGSWSTSALTGDSVIRSNKNLILQASYDGASHMIIRTSGNVGIGTASPAFTLDVTGSGRFNSNINGPPNGFVVNNTNSGSAAYSIIQIGNDTANYLSMFLNSSTRTTDGGARGATLRNDGGSLRLQSSASGSSGIYVHTTGSVMINGGALDGNYVFQSNSVVSGGQSLNGQFAAYKDTSFTLAIYTVDPLHAGWNGAAGCLYVTRSTSTSRSINAAGTVNASGADYAEYMKKNGNFTLQKGDIIGIDTNGLLTNQYDQAISFSVKSTNPSIVGGDDWGNTDVIGLRPPEPTENSTEEEIQTYNQWLENFEQERQKVDRIAFAGQVPVNVYNTTPGDYIIPIRKEDGTIGGINITENNITFDNYKKAVGKVVKILPDGRAQIIVKVV